MCAASNGGSPRRPSDFRDRNVPGQASKPGITCEVTDGSPATPRHTKRAPDAERGRGLTIVEALARSSGVRASQGGKTSWFTLALTDRAHRAARQIEHKPEAGA